MILQGDHLLDDLGEAFGGSGGGLANIPLTLNRWTEESRVLDGDAAHDYITGTLLSFILSVTILICCSTGLAGPSVSPFVHLFRTGS